MVRRLTLMFDDFGDCPVVNGKGQRDGHLKVSDFKFGGVQDFVPTDNSGYVDELYTKNGEIEDPESDQVPIPAGYVKKDNIVPTNTGNYTITSTDEGFNMHYTQAAEGYEQCGYYSSNIFDNGVDVILVVKNLAPKEVILQIKIKGASNYLVSSVDVLSNASTGRLARWSSSTPNVPYLGIAGGRTCQFKFTLTEANAKSIAFVANPGTASEGDMLFKGIYCLPRN